MEAAAAQENAGNQAQAEADGEAQSEAAAAWQEAWEEENKENAELLASLDTKYLKCTALLVLYVEAYLQLVPETHIGDITMSACDAYGMQALAILKREKVSILATGLKMRRMDGLELLAHVNRHHPVVPCFVMTAYGSPALKKKLPREIAKNLILPQ